MTDNDIIKAFVCYIGIPECNECPYRPYPQNCKELMMHGCLNLINRQKAEIEDLREIVFTDRTDSINLLKAEAIKDFAERLKDVVDEPKRIDGRVIDLIIDKIDNLADELISEKCVNQDENYTENVEKTAMIKDSGNRRQFETGAVRDIQEGKGRCDLLPLDVVAWVLGANSDADAVLDAINRFMQKGNIMHLYEALENFRNMLGIPVETMLLEVSKHFEEGCKKYGERNWQKGIPTSCYIDSAVRHYLKWLRGDDDEPHDRAFCWNILCCIWTCNNKPELNVYGKNTSDAYCIVCGKPIPEGRHICPICKNGGEAE